VIGFVGRLVDWKGIDVFLEAAERLLERRDDVAFVVLGDVPVGSTHATLDDYRSYVRERGMAERVKLLGFKENATEYVRDFRALVVPSVRPDPCPRTVLEGMAVGTPIIGSASGGIREVLRHDVTGLLVTPGRADDIVVQVERILDDPDLANDVAVRARRAVEEDFNAEGVSRRIQTILTEEMG
jgi:glycosyltransferase involved in cell wall biosynthesis